MDASLFSLKGKVAVITGGRRGIGKAIALGFAGVGADIAVADIVADDGALDAVVSEVKKLGRRAIAVKVDVTRQADIEQLVARVERELGGVDILVNNAGIGSRYTITDTSEEEWHRVMDTDLTSCHLCSRAVAKGMMARKKGNIISMASGSGLRGWDMRNTYNVAKAGVIMLTKVLARDLGKYGIRANAIAPTRIVSDMTEDILKDPKAAAAEAARVPLGRLGEVSDIVGPAIFLASDASAYITGHTLIVDGGQLA